MTTLLVDTCLWVDHFRRGVRVLEAHLRAFEVVTHPAILGELVLGGLGAANRRLLRWVPAIEPLDDAAVLTFVDEHRLSGAGIGWVDCHLLASVARQPRTRLWTRDKKLQACADALGLGNF